MGKQLLKYLQCLHLRSHSCCCTSVSFSALGSYLALFLKRRLKSFNLSKRSREDRSLIYPSSARLEMEKENMGKREKFLKATFGRLRSRSRPRSPVPQSPVPSNGSSSTANTVPANEISGGGLAVGAESATQIAEIASMGFQRSQIDLAMRAAFDNSERAIEYLLNVSHTEGTLQYELIQIPGHPRELPIRGKTASSCCPCCFSDFCRRGSKS
jgi:hypothetical protein